MNENKTSIPNYCPAKGMYRDTNICFFSPCIFPFVWSPIRQVSEVGFNASAEACGKGKKRIAWEYFWGFVFQNPQHLEEYRGLREGDKKE